ncbi:hypothetical protein DRF68_06750 [Candidatus Chryseobacterium massiliae]|uniref:Uncharacterized protein n=1 Tax=Candidatus Chryseobacterium massiliense TaxID=204089 RepID=A0A3D9BCL9_9FLAO|nr:hypothetical protein DRF68_06750 [Candidatus Chryseobacterium massiliae]
MSAFCSFRKFQLSAINYQLSTINYQLSTINYQLSTNSLFRSFFQLSLLAFLRFQRWLCPRRNLKKSSDMPLNLG